MEIDSRYWPTLNAIVAYKFSWSRPEDLADQLGCSEETQLDLLGEMDADGLIVVWPDAPFGPAVTLSSLAAEILQVVTSEEGEYPHFVPIGKQGPIRDYSEFDSIPEPDRLVDPRTEVSGWLADEPWWPTLLLGSTIFGRYVAGCPGCGNHHLGPRAYCLKCDRWGLDGVPEAMWRKRWMPNG